MIDLDQYRAQLVAMRDTCREISDAFTAVEAGAFQRAIDALDRMRDGASTRVDL